MDSFTEWGQTPEDLIATNDSLLNSYTNPSLVKKNIPGKRIDYIMYHPGANVHVDLINYDLPLPNRVPDENFSYSDHEAVSATLYLNSKEILHNFINDEIKQTTLEESVGVCNDALANLMKNKTTYFLMSFFLFVILLVTFCISSPVGYVVLFYIFKLLLSIIIIFSILMATIWHRIEKHGILAGKLAMEISLKTLKSKKT